MGVGGIGIAIANVQTVWVSDSHKFRDINCDNKEGRYVFVVMRRKDYLTLCEVEVYPSKQKEWDARVGPTATLPGTVKYVKEQTGFRFTKGGEVGLLKL